MFKRGLTLDNSTQLNYYYIMTDTYYESAEAMTISYERAMQELDDHGIDEQGKQEFFDEVGDLVEYSAQKVLDWLGY